MKKILLLISILCIGFLANAQITNLQKITKIVHSYKEGGVYKLRISEDGSGTGSFKNFLKDDGRLDSLYNGQVADSVAFNSYAGPKYDTVWFVVFRFPSYIDRDSIMVCLISGTGDKGDITITDGDYTIDAGVVTYAKMQDIPTSAVLGRYSAGTGSPQPMAAGSMIDLSTIPGEINVVLADGSIEGAVSATTQNFDGLKTFNDGLSGKWKPIVGTTASSATPTINTDAIDIYTITALTVDITSMTTNLSGSPVNGEIIEIQITGTAARAISWGASFVDGPATLPTTTTSTTTLIVGLQWTTGNSFGTNKWVCRYSSE